MKKLMALCLSLLMALSMVSFSVMAEETAVDFSAIANGQPATFVTSNLVLGENVITSSNEAVIALDGTVTRPIVDDATVSLTINGGEAFDVVVKAKTTNVLYANDFSSNVGSEWSLPVPTGNTASSVTDGALHVIIGATTVARTWNYYYPAALASDAPVTFQFDMSNITDLASAGSDIRISGSRYDAEGNKIGGFSTITVARCNTTSGFGSYWMGKASKNVTIKYDPTTGEFWGNGVLYSKDLFTCADTNFAYDTGKTSDDCAKVVITQIGFTNAAGSCTATFDMDNFVQWQEVSAEDALATATPAEKLANYSKYLEKDYVANGGNLDALTTNLKFTADETLPEGMSLVWTSTDPAIASDGTVKRSMTETKTATITGTLTVDGAEPVVKSYNVKILPRTIVGESEILDFEGIAEGTAIETTDNWTSASSALTAVTAKEADGNTYLRLVSDATTAYNSVARQYTFTNVPSVTNAEYIIMEAKVHVPAAWTSCSAVNLTLNLNGTKAGEFMIGSAGSPGVIYGGGLLTGNPWHTGATRVGTRTQIPTSDFIDLKIKINPQTGKVEYYQKGNLVDHVTYTAGTTYVPNLTELSSATLNVAWRQAIGEIWLDDVKLYTEASPETVMATLSDSEKVDFYKSLIAASNIGTATVEGAVLDLDNGYADYAPATYGVTVDWTSDNTTYIANDGTVAKLVAHGEDVTVNMTATITAGEASDTVTLPVAVGSETTLIDSVDYDDTSVSVGNATYGTDAEYGSIVTMTNPTEGAHKGSGTLTSLTGAGRYDRVVFEADMKYTDDGASFASGGIGLKTISGSAGINVYLNYTTNKVQLTTTAAYANAAGTGLEATSAKTIYYQIPQAVLAKGEGAWVHLMVDHNVLSQTYNVYLDGILVNDVPLLQANMCLTSNGGAAIRGYSLELSGKGTVCADNLELYKYTDANAVEVNAALNAALIQFASDIQAPVLVNQELPAMTIGKSWVNSSDFFRDLNEGAIKPTNVSTYTYVTDGPAITYAIDGQAVTAVNVASPKEVQLTITATANGITESKTVTRKVAPVAIRDLALGTADCLNGAWLEGAAGDEKLIVAKYLEDALVSAFVVNLAETGEWDALKGTGDRYDEATGLVNNLSTSHPNETAAYDQIKIFVVDADGITPLAYADASLKD